MVEQIDLFESKKSEPKLTGIKQLPLKSFLKPISRPVSKPKEKFLSLGIRSHGKGTFLKPDFDPTKINMDTLYRVEKNDLIVNITFAWEGAIALVQNWDHNALVSHRFPTYTFKTDTVIPEYFQYVIIQERFKYYLRIISPGGAGRNRVLNKKDFLNLTIGIPPLSEQKKIAQILTAWDRAIDLTERLIKAKEKRKKGLMQQLLTGKVRFGEFGRSENFENTKLGLKPVDWKCAKIEDVVETYSGGTPSRSRTEFFGGDIPWIKSGELNQKWITQTDEFITGEGVKNSSAKYVEPNTILLALYGATAGVVGISKIKATINQAILALLADANKIDNIFLYYSLEFLAPIMLKKLQGGQPNLSADLVKKSLLFLPHLTEQQKIAKVLATNDQEIELLRKKLDALKVQKKGLMQQLLTGKARVKV